PARHQREPPRGDRALRVGRLPAHRAVQRQSGCDAILREIAARRRAAASRVVIEAPSAVLPDAVEEAALTELGDAVERRDLVGDEGPPEPSPIPLPLARVLPPRVRAAPFPLH